MRAALYARVSQDKQRENYSIPTQLEAMREYCQRNGWNIVKEYVEDESGAKLTRPTLDQVREDVVAGLFDILVCHDVDRLGRNLGHQILLEEEFAKHGVVVKYVLGDYKDNPEGRLTKHIKGVIAEYEREKIIERTFRGRLGRAKAGQVSVAGYVPYGYRYRSDGRKGWLKIVPEEARVVQEIYRLYIEEGLSFQVIAKTLTERHIPTAGDRTSRETVFRKRRSGYGEWAPPTVRGILTNETYAGVWYDNKRKGGKSLNPTGEWVPVSVPPIVSREVWQQAQERRASNRQRMRRRPKYPYLLAGLLTCGSCGRAFIGMTSIASSGRGPKLYHYYRCTDSARTWRQQCCHEGKLYAEEADALVWDKVAEALKNPELLTREYGRQLEDNNGSKAEERLNQIQAELNKLKRQQDRNLDLYTNEEIDMPTLKKRQELLRGRKASLEREKEALQRILERNNTDMSSITQFCELISQGLDAVTFEEKRQILRLLNIEGRVKDSVITLTGCIPESCDYRLSRQAQSG